MMKACAASEAFFYVDQTRDGVTYRIFSYRLASYTDFCMPDALNCRGTMFQMEGDAPVRLASLPFEKFFNHGENPFTLDVDFTQTKVITVKQDGSLISSYMHNDSLALKSKASLASEQAIAAEAFLARPENEKFLIEVLALTKLGFTVIMEWCSPNNRIVLPYARDGLFVLGIRLNADGTYVHFKSDAPLTVKNNWTPMVTHHYETDAEFVSNVPKLTEIEGYVITLENDQKIKIKTEWYLVRHRLKDSISHPRHLFEAIITESVDDVKTLFAEDVQTLDTIARMEQMVIPKYNHMISTVEGFYAENKELSRKDYALKAQALDDGYMGLYMNMYLGRTNDYKAFAVKYYETFGVKDFQMVVNAGD